MKLTISRKLILSYLAMALLTILASAYAAISLQELNGLAYTIINRDFFVLETSRKMIDGLFSQESAEKKYLILKDPSIADIFWTRSGEFNKGLEGLKGIHVPAVKDKIVEISKKHDQYNVLFTEETSLIKEGLVQDATVKSDTEGKKLIEATIFLLRAIQQQAEKDIDANMNLIKVRGLRASRMTAILSVISLLTGFGLALLITYDISKPLKKLEKATGLIAQGQFDHDLNIRRRDEIGSLAGAFSVMTDRLKELEALNLDASPLTGLPGNLAIQLEIEKRLSTRRMFSLCHVDLDNFKPFADRYGYAWGSEVIKEVGNIIMDKIRIWGKGDDFVGHIGGDDFILASTPDRAEKICQQVVKDFDQRINQFYNEKDRQKGFIVGKDRQGIQQKFPLITITIAIVSDDGSRFNNPLDMAEKAAELKERAKALPGSNCLKQEDIEKLQAADQPSLF
ncbi:MAG: diguanylate cyclase [Deltaproteobacteria bacterium]|nr:diguanylate cyclase [Deltaproteobacteria bacterium]